MACRILEQSSEESPAWGSGQQRGQGGDSDHEPQDGHADAARPGSLGKVALVAAFRRADQCHHVADEQRTAHRQQQPHDQVVAQEDGLTEHLRSVPWLEKDRAPAARETVAMGFHHVALATRDTAATHHFYTEVMGFRLVKVNVAPNPGEHGGWSKHFFYATNSGDGHDDQGSTDNGMIAFWEIHDTEIGDSFPVDINRAAGLPWWVNHIAFDAPTHDDLERHRERWRSHGHTVLEIGHDFCTSIYIRDPNNNMVEFCHTTREFTDAERGRALQLLLDASPAFDEHAASVTIHQPLTPAV
jgi:catechol 2,3-dioxygenase-like lactoylglutathione lyase family enzyme